ncbi:hypothetical protein [Gordonia westfalica]|uniref:Uncharacterized protein n=1 Tax=Gordonia westfalica TaxID=158898 RepID=A0A1H2DR04_9ACTN|nr:hypothetical protein [Gordonia westfalica]SDT85337.1 hypothetical protein SAMN04488548_11851 [Gordonia westfalica]SDT89498.1 hypothetical protein SAMN04488548_12742 [Gordonia westfalica]
MTAACTAALLRAVEHAIENELDGFTTEQIRDMRGYVAETVTWRLSRDGYLQHDIEESL